MKAQILGIAATMMILASAASPARERISLNRDWRFARGDNEAAMKISFNDKDWETVNVPHDFLISQPWVAPGADEKADLTNPVANVKSRLSARGFKEMGKGWYRKSFTPPASWKGKRILLDFEGIMLVGDVYLNGERVGGTDYGYLGFEADVTDRIRPGEENIIAVLADTGKPENSRWYTGAGLFRDVTAVATDPDLFFTRHPFRILTPEVGKDRAVVRIEAEISAKKFDGRELKAKVKVTAPDGSVVSDRTVSVPFDRRMKVREYLLDSIVVEKPELWSPENPARYMVEATLLSPENNDADRVSTKFGLRRIEFSPEFGLKVNGKKTLLKGIANHHTLGALGAAAYPRAMEKRLQLLKDFGFNHVRTSHNPYSESFLNLCDSLGILVVDELYDKWLTQYAGGRREWTELWQHDVPEFVKRDRNHPSVVMWSLGNELQTLWEIPYADWGVTPYRMQRELLKRYDDTRPVTVGMHPRGRNLATDSLPAPLALETDVASYNYRYMYFPGDSRRFPWMMFYQSEANTSNMGPNYFDMNLDKVIGLAYWGMIDYLGESLGWPSKGWTQGVFDISLEPKPMAYFLRSIFKEDEPIVHVAVAGKDDNTLWNDVKVGTREFNDHWNYEKGDTVPLFTFTNADEVELIVNGKSYGKKDNDRAHSSKRNRIFWENVVYAPGYVEARAYKTGSLKPVAVHRVETAGKPVRLRLSADNASWKADGIDLQHIRVEAVDSKGRRVPAAADELTFTVEGPAEIAGVINGDLSSDEPMTGNRRSLHKGTASVILRAGEKKGKVRLKVSSPRFRDAYIDMNLSEQ